MKRYIIPILMVAVLLVLMAVPCMAFDGSYTDNGYGVTYRMRIQQSALAPAGGSGNWHYYRYGDIAPTAPGTWTSDVYEYEQGDSVGYGYLTMKANPDFDSDGYRLSVAINECAYYPNKDTSSLPSIVLDVDQTRAPVTVHYEWSAYTTDGRLLDKGVVDFTTTELYGYDLFKDIDTDVDPDFINFKNISIEANVYDGRDFERISFRIPFYTGLVANAPISGDVEVVHTITDVSDVGDFLYNSVGNFLRFEIMPSVSLWALLLALCGLGITIWILKLVAGG